MNKIDQLFIRACKSKNPYKRLKSIRRRFYIHLAHDDYYITLKLTEICDKYLPVKSSKILEELIHPFMLRDAPIQDKLFRIFLNNIRFADASVFPGFIPPAYYRNKINKEVIKCQ